MTRDVGNFVHDLVEMAKAMDELPQVRRAFELANQRNDELARTVQDRELAIIDYKVEIEALNARVRTVEAERDDAEIRFLELDEKAAKLFDLSLGIQGAVSDLVKGLDETKVKPQPEPVQPPVPEVVHSIEPQPQDQSEINPPAQPSASTSDTPNDAGQAHATTTDAGSIGGEGSGAKSGPYTGKHYFDHPVYVPYWDWIDGGGTEESYRWHPGVGSSA